MGLDMYLKKQITPVDTRGNNKITVNTLNGEENIEVGIIDHIQVSVGKWRNANQIHKWFVDNVQDGTDDCETYEVSIEQLCSLHMACKLVLEDKSLAPELLPTYNDFICENLGYDEFYFENIEYTEKILSEILDDLFSKKMKLLEDLAIEEQYLEHYKALEQMKFAQQTKKLVYLDPMFIYRSSY